MGCWGQLLHAEHEKSRVLQLENVGAWESEGRDVPGSS